MKDIEGLSLMKTSPFYLLGETAYELHNYLCDNSIPKKNHTIIMKRMPYFFEWIERSTNHKEYFVKLYEFLRNRQKFYLPIKKLKRKASTKEQAKLESESRSIQTKRAYKRINDNLKKVSKYIEENLDYSGYNGYLNFLKGFDNREIFEDRFLQSWIGDTFIERFPILKLSFYLGYYYFKVSEVEIRKIRNLGLTKKLLATLNQLKSDNLMDLFKKVNKTYFYCIRPIEKGDNSSSKGFDSIVNLRINITDLLIKIYESDQKNIKQIQISDDLIRLSFSWGFLVRKISTEVDQGDYSELSLPKNNINEFNYDLGKLLALTTRFEISELGSRSYTNQVGNVRNYRGSSIHKIFFQINYILIRNWIINQIKLLKSKSKSIEKKEVKNAEKVTYSPSIPDYSNFNLAHRAILRFIKHFDEIKDQSVEIANFAFMLGYISIPMMKKQLKK